MLTLRVHTLAQRPLDYALGEFPLNTRQIQAIVLSEQRLEMLRDLEHAGFRCITHYSHIRLMFHRGTLPGLRRHVVIVVRLQRGIFAKRDTSESIRVTAFHPNDEKYLVPDIQALDPDARGKLCAWLNKAVRQARLSEIARHTGSKVIDDYAQTAAHLRGFWPTLVTVFADEKQQSARHRRLEESDWAERFRNLPKATEPYEPDPKVLARFRPFMDAADSVFLAAMLSEPYTRPAGAPVVVIEHWEKRAGDPVLPK